MITTNLQNVEDQLKKIKALVAKIQFFFLKAQNIINEIVDSKNL